MTSFAESMGFSPELEAELPAGKERCMSCGVAYDENLEICDYCNNESEENG